VAAILEKPDIDHHMICLMDGKSMSIRICREYIGLRTCGHPNEISFREVQKNHDHFTTPCDQNYLIKHDD
jgi:hypothetical protein